MRIHRWLALVTLAAVLGGLLPAGALARTTVAWQPGGNRILAGLGGGAIEPDDFESDDSPDEANELVLDGVPQERTLHVPSDADWVTIELTAGDRIHLYTTGDCDTFMFLIDSNLSQILRRDDDSGENLNASIEFTTREDGVYYVRVIPFDNQDPCPSYGLVGELLPPIPPDAYEPDDDPTTAQVLPFDGSTQERSIHAAGDQDWVALPLQAGNRLNIFTTGRCDMLMFLYAPDGVTLLIEDDDSGVGLNPDIEYVATETGTYLARIQFIDDSDACETYGLSAALLPPVQADAYEADDSKEQAKPLPLDGTPQFRTFHNNSDTDWVTFNLNSTDRLFLMTTGPCDTLLFLYGEDGTTLLRRDDDSGEDLNAALLYTALTTGTYYARVAPISRARGICDGYRLYGSRFPVNATTPTPTPPASPGASVTTTPTVPQTPDGAPPTQTQTPAPATQSPAPTTPTLTPQPTPGL